MKRLSTILTTLAMLLLCLFLLPTEAEAAEIASGTCGDNLTWVLDDNGTLTISGSGDMDDFIHNDQPWKQKANSIKNVVIENGVTDIGAFAFRPCSKLISVTIPDSVTTIEGWAFNECSELTSITIPNSVTNIGTSAFNSCSGLTSVTIPSSVTNIGDSAFAGCANLTAIWVNSGNLYYSNDDKGALFSKVKSILIQCPSGLVGEYTIPSNVTSIGASAFNSCSGLTSVTIPNSVTSIGDYAFGGCTGLTSIAIPNSVTSIGYGAFYECSGLTSVTIPSRIIRIEQSAFWGCIGLTSVSIPNSVTSIGYAAFRECSGLTSITIPSSVAIIESDAFFGCDRLTSVIIGNRIDKIEHSAFGACYTLEHVLYAGTQEDWEYIVIYSDNEYLRNATRHYNCTGNELTVQGCSICQASCSHVPGPNATPTTDQVCTICGKILKTAIGEGQDNAMIVVIPIAVLIVCSAAAGIILWKKKH